MRTGYPQTEKTGATIAVYLAACMLVLGVLVFTFYNLFQPHHVTNPGLAAYAPPPATVLRYAATTRHAYAQATTLPTATGEPSHDTPDETTGRVPQVAERAEPIAPIPVPAPVALPQVRRPLAARPARTRSGETRVHRAASARAERTASGAWGGSRSLSVFSGYAAVQ